MEIVPSFCDDISFLLAAAFPTKEACATPVLGSEVGSVSLIHVRIWRERVLAKVWSIVKRDQGGGSSRRFGDGCHARG